MISLKNGRKSPKPNRQTSPIIDTNIGTANPLLTFVPDRSIDPALYLINGTGVMPDNELIKVDRMEL